MQSLSLSTVSGADTQQLYQQGRIQSSSLSTETYLEELMAGLQRSGLSAEGALGIIKCLLFFVGSLAGWAHHTCLDGPADRAHHDDLLVLVQLLQGCLLIVRIALCRSQIISHTLSPSVTISKALITPAYICQPQPCLSGLGNKKLSFIFLFDELMRADCSSQAGMATVSASLHQKKRS